MRHESGFWRCRASRGGWEGTRSGGAGNACAQGARTEPEKESTVRGTKGTRASSQDAVRRDVAVSECEYDNQHSTQPS
ncbi:hypothetical protein K438DRAFT_1855154 [Mycena galopus ATCC 62051]|nr:hypothetical protein K438DRAFT_1855154 [Mycena galopus ATCC 62051]